MNLDVVGSVKAVPWSMKVVDVFCWRVDCCRSELMSLGDRPAVVDGAGVLYRSIKSVTRSTFVYGNCRCRCILLESGSEKI